MEAPQVENGQEAKVEETKDAVAVEVKEAEKPVEKVEAEAEEKETSEEKPEEKTETEKLENGNAEKKEENGEEAKKEEASEPSEQHLRKIKNQLEFYFGNVNLQRDRFLIEQTKLDEGWVPLTVMLKFKMLASLSEDIDVILKALEGSDLIEISADRKKIRRSTEKPLPVFNEDYRKAQEARTLYLKGFPTDTTIEILKEYYDDNATIENIVMRKYKKGKEFFFKGSIFLQFKTLEDAKAFMEMESVKFGETVLTKLWSADYSATKAVEKEERKQKKGGKNDNNKQSKDDNSDPKKENKKGKEDESPFPKGCVIHVSGISEEITREDFKQYLTELGGQVAFVDFKKGDATGWVRLQGENGAQGIMDKLEDNKMKINDTEMDCRVLKDEEEQQYLKKIKSEIANNRRRKGGRDFSRGRGRGQKRRHSPHRDNGKKQQLG